MLLKVARFGIAKYKLELPNPKLSGGVSVDRRTLFDTITFFIRAIVYENSAPWQKIGETEVKDAIWEMSAFACVAQENEVDFEIMREINYGLDPSSEAVGYTNWKSHEKAAHERMAADARAYFRSLGPFSDSCDFCGAEEQMGSKLQRCEACKASRYCSKECQRGAWKDGHRETCGKAWGQLMRLGKRTLKSEDREDFRSNLELNLPTSQLFRPVNRKRCDEIRSSQESKQLSTPSFRYHTFIPNAAPK